MEFTQFTESRLGIDIPQRIGLMNMLRFKEVREAAKEQVTFTSLILHIDPNPEYQAKVDPSTWTPIFGDVRLLYPNLEDIAFIDVNPQRCHHRTHRLWFGHNAAYHHIAA